MRVYLKHAQVSPQSTPDPRLLQGLSLGRGVGLLCGLHSSPWHYPLLSVFTAGHKQ